MKLKKGFTLIELIVVIAIIGILATMGFSAYTNSINKSKDSRRKSDLRAIMTALQVYYNDNGVYPLADGCAKGQSDCYTMSTGSSGVGGTPWISALTSTYIKNLPVDPVNNGDFRSKGGYSYAYGNVDGNQQSYELVAQLEWKNDPDACVFKHYTKNITGAQWCPTPGQPTDYLFQLLSP